MTDAANVLADVIPLDANERAKKMRKKAKELSGQLETSYMELAKILHEVSEPGAADVPPLYKQWGFETFENYAQEELNLHERKAKHLRRIWYRLEVELAGLSHETKVKIIQLGWTKVRELIRVLTVQNADEWAERAKVSSYANLCVYVRRYLDALEEAQAQAPQSGPPSRISLPDAEKFVHKHFPLSLSQAEVVNGALEKASVIAKSDSNSHLLTMICMDFVATTVTGNDDDATIRYLAQLEDKLGYKLVIVDPRTNEVVFGIKTLQKVAGVEEGE
jgi:hypothetical protein